MSIICSDCGHHNSVDEQFCTRCGSYLSEEISTADKFSIIEENLDVDIATQEFSNSVNQSIDELDETIQHSSNCPEAFSQAVNTSTNFQVVSSHQSFSSTATSNFSQPVLIEQDTDTKFELPTNVNTINIGRIHGKVPIHVDLTHINHADLISRFHAAIRVENGVYYLEDMNSANGTWLNDKLLESGAEYRQLLNHGDTIAFGRNQTVRLTFYER